MPRSRPGSSPTSLATTRRSFRRVRPSPMRAACRWRARSSTATGSCRRQRSRLRSTIPPTRPPTPTRWGWPAPRRSSSRARATRWPPRAGTARELGYQVTDLGDQLQAEARHLGASHAALSRRLARDGAAARGDLGRRNHRNRRQQEPGAAGATSNICSAWRSRSTASRHLCARLRHRRDRRDGGRGRRDRHARHAGARRGAWAGPAAHLAQNNAYLSSKRSAT